MSTTTELSMLNAALDLAEMGFYVFPVAKGGKTPLIKGWPAQASRDRSVIAAWWNEWPDANIGAAPDRSGHFVVDLDRKDGKDGVAAFSELAKPHGGSPTFAVKTPTGGYHLWFRGQASNSTSRLATGVDVRGRSGYVVMPPSVIGDAKYKVAKEADIAEAPAWLLALTQKPHAKASEHQGEPVEWGDFEYVLACIPNPTTRNDWRDIVAAVRATNSGTEEERLELLKKKIDPGHHEEMQVIWDTMPPKDGGLDYGTLHHLAKKAVEGSGEVFSLPSWEPRPSAEVWASSELANIVANARAEKARTLREDTAPGAGDKRPIKLWSIDECLNRPLPTPLIDDIVMEGENIIWLGEFKKGKSLAMIDIALSVAAGVSAFGHFKVHRPGPVVYLSSEGETYLSERLSAWLHSRGLTPDDVRANFKYVFDVPIASDPSDVDRYIAPISEWLDGRTPSLIIIDTMSRTLGVMDENTGPTMNLYETMTRKLMREFGCVVFTVGHTGKDPDKLLRGHSSGLANFDAYILYKASGDDRVAIRTGRGIDPEPFEVARLLHDWTGPDGEGHRGEVVTFRKHVAGSDKAIVRSHDPYDFHLVEEQLQRMGAFAGAPTMISAKTLAQALFPDRDEETWDRAAKQLNKLASIPEEKPRSLAALRHKAAKGKADFWHAAQTEAEFRRHDDEDPGFGVTL